MRPVVLHHSALAPRHVKRVPLGLRQENTTKVSSVMQEHAGGGFFLACEDFGRMFRFCLLLLLLFVCLFLVVVVVVGVFVCGCCLFVCLFVLFCF